MRWPITIIVLSLVAAIPLGLYRLESQVQTLERRLAEAAAQLEDNRRNTRILAAEWSFLSQPNRVQALARRHLALRSVATAQIGSIASLPMKPGGQGVGDKSRNNGAGDATVREHGPTQPAGPPVPRWKPIKPGRGELIVLASRGGQP